MFDIIEKNKKIIQCYKEDQNRYINLIIGTSLEIKTLGDVCFFNPRSIKTGDNYEEINYIDISSVKEGSLKEIKNLKEDFPSRAKRIIEKNDILYSTVRPNLKGYVYMNEIVNNCIASTGFAQIRVKDEKTTLSKFIYYIIIEEKILNLVVNKAKGAQYPAISVDDLLDVVIPIPSKEKQEKIVNYCDHIEEKIKEIEMEIEKHKELINDFLE